MLHSCYNSFEGIGIVKRGLFITFEGVDGCGKTTQMKKLSDFLSSKGYDVVLTREPGGIGLGEKIREILLHFDGDVSSRAESFLFLADRAQNIDKIVNPAVEKGQIVLCDRHTDSTIAYQGYGRGVDIRELMRLNDIAVSGRKPDLTFVFDIDVQTSMQRVGQEKDRMESSGIEFFNRVRNGYLEIAKIEPSRVKVIDATRSIEDVYKDVSGIINGVLTV